MNKMRSKLPLFLRFTINLNNRNNLFLLHFFLSLTPKHTNLLFQQNLP